MLLQVLYLQDALLALSRVDSCLILCEGRKKNKKNKKEKRPSGSAKLAHASLNFLKERHECMMKGRHGQLEGPIPTFDRPPCHKGQRRSRSVPAPAMWMFFLSSFLHLVFLDDEDEGKWSNRATDSGTVSLQE